MGWVFNNAVVDAFDWVSAWNYDPADDLTDKLGSNHGTNSGSTDTAGKNLRGRLLNGVNQSIVVPNNPSLSFGDGLADRPFSFVTWVNMVDATAFPIIGKWNVIGGNREWLFDTNATDKLRLLLYDESVVTAPSLTSNAALTASQGSWIMVGVSYDGRGGADAMDGAILYVNGSPVASTAVNRINYVAMEPRNNDVWIGRQSGVYAEGSNDEVAISDEVVSPEAFAALWNGGAGLFLKQAPEVDSFTATPSEVVNGTDITLAWRTSHATSVSIDQGIGVVVVDGDTVVNPLDTTLYTLKATGPGGTATATALVTVGDGALAADNIRRVLGRYRRPRR